MSPIYEYSCAECTLKRDFMMSVRDTAPVCPICGHIMTKEVSLNAPPQFKGSGFFATDYKERKTGKPKND